MSATSPQEQWNTPWALDKKFLKYQQGTLGFLFSEEKRCKKLVHEKCDNKKLVRFLKTVSEINIGNKKLYQQGTLGFLFVDEITKDIFGADEPLNFLTNDFLTYAFGVITVNVS